jgi:hypothetical protein
VFCDEVRCLERRADDPVGGWAAGVGGVSLRCDWSGELAGNLAC